jgi:hypothetical protein
VIISALRSVVSFLEVARLDYMLIGGFALPFYGMIRSTIDIDVAVSVHDRLGFDAFLRAVAEAGFKHTLGTLSDPVTVFLDRETGLEFEFWTRPDGVEWDEETLRRRRRYRLDGFDAWVISPEDFIVNKLARPDRGVQDEKDVKSVLVRLKGSLDREYLERRAENAGVLALLKAIDEIS